jgi:hypothetical protein
MTSLPLAGGLRRGAILAVVACTLTGPAAASAHEGAPQIVGGSEADISEYPWQVVLEFNDAYYQGTTRERFACGGTLIAPRNVLTEAHCVYDVPIAGIGFNPGDQFEAITGRTSISGGGDAAIDVSAVRYLVSGPGGPPVQVGRAGAATGSGCRRSTSSVRATRVPRTSAGRCAASGTTASACGARTRLAGARTRAPGRRHRGAGR